MKTLLHFSMKKGPSSKSSLKKQKPSFGGNSSNDSKITLRVEALGNSIPVLQRANCFNSIFQYAKMKSEQTN